MGGEFLILGKDCTIQDNDKGGVRLFNYYRGALMEEMEVLEIEIDEGLKEQAEAILQEMGLDLETAIILFIKECIRIKGLPFELDDPLLGVKPQANAKDHSVTE